MAAVGASHARGRCGCNGLRPALPLRPVRCFMPAGLAVQAYNPTI